MSLYPSCKKMTTLTYINDIFSNMFYKNCSIIYYHIYNINLVKLGCVWMCFSKREKYFLKKEIEKKTFSIIYLCFSKKNRSKK